MCVSDIAESLDFFSGTCDAMKNCARRHTTHNRKRGGDMTDRKTCAKCNGKGEVEHWRNDGTMQQCHYCKGTGSWPTLSSQYSAILELLRGKKTGLRKSRPAFEPTDCDFDTRVKHDRAYYIWRLARFHGGVDLHLPMGASFGSAGDPDHELLDAMAEDMAKRYLGTDMAAAKRWGRALGVI